MWSRSTKQRRAAMRRKQSVVIRRAISAVVASIHQRPWQGFTPEYVGLRGLESWLPMPLVYGTPGWDVKALQRMAVYGIADIYVETPPKKEQ